MKNTGNHRIILYDFRFKGSLYPPLAVEFFYQPGDPDCIDGPSDKWCEPVDEYFELQSVEILKSKQLLTLDDEKADAIIQALKKL